MKHFYVFFLVSNPNCNSVINTPKFQILAFEINIYLTKDAKNAVVDNIYDIKDFKKLIRTKTNVLVCYTNSLKQASQVIKVFREAADVIKGQGTMVLMDCSGYFHKSSNHSH